ncbi:capsule polysaccharide export protein KpsC-like [Teleopsis dalmanni]|uniref:capsule polysaccharide export protein KpsC-like n=1 Tax=Teleopsis dalmanni TaxID=139649 RepID=UPI0018CD5B78|nr:capsule polysaccharide export protein KpsC-like [Teleopsis dalmanni]
MDVAALKELLKQQQESTNKMLEDQRAFFKQILLQQTADGQSVNVPAFHAFNKQLHKCVFCWSSRVYGAPLVRIEDAFLRSVRPGRGGGGGPLGLLIDPYGVHFDASQPSLLEHLLARHPLDDPALLRRAGDGIARLKAANLSKYNDFDPDLPAPQGGYVLVVDQTAGDASIRWGGATAQTFQQMLAQAREDFPAARILIRTHPETRDGLRAGHFGPKDTDARTQIFADPVSPWTLLAGAQAVYTVSSLMGYEAILAGHRPKVFGQPFYAGWGLSDDVQPIDRRHRSLTVEQVFAASHILAPTWFDPCRQRLCSFEEAMDQLEAEVRAWREDRFGYVATGMRLWKRRPLQQFFGRVAGVQFVDPPTKAVTRTDRPLLVWAGKEPVGFPASGRRVEDGFLRSRGLGADLIPPLSLVSDRQGIYYDPQRPSDMEHAIQTPLPAGGADRIDRAPHSGAGAGRGMDALPLWGQADLQTPGPAGTGRAD